MIVTNSKKLAERASLLKDLAHSPKKRFLHTDLAYNYRMTNMQAAIGLAQLKKIKRLIKKKRRIASLYHKHLKNVEGLRLPIEEEWAKNVYWMYAVLVEDNLSIGRDALRNELLKEGIGTRDFFAPMHQQPIIKRLGLVDEKYRYPVADYISERGLYLPTGLALKESDVIYVCRKVKQIHSKARKAKRVK